MAASNMNNLQMYCISMEPSHFSFIKNLESLDSKIKIKIFQKVGSEIIQSIIFLTKINIMESTLFIIGCGRIILIN